MSLGGVSQQEVVPTFIRVGDKLYGAAFGQPPALPGRCAGTTRLRASQAECASL